MKTPMKIGFVYSVLLPGVLFAQNTTNSATASVEVPPKQLPLAKKATFNALLVGDYAVSMTKNTDIYGKIAQAWLPVMAFSCGMPVCRPKWTSRKIFPGKLW